MAAVPRAWKRAACSGGMASSGVLLAALVLAAACSAAATGSTNRELLQSDPTNYYCIAGTDAPGIPTGPLFLSRTTPPAQGCAA